VIQRQRAFSRFGSKRYDTARAITASRQHRSAEIANEVAARFMLSSPASGLVLVFLVGMDAGAPKFQ
jgi:hypothetical protein